MADSRVANLTHQGGLQHLNIYFNGPDDDDAILIAIDVTRINDAKIKPDVIQLPNQLGYIYVIDKAFTTVAEVQEVMDQVKKPAAGPSPA